MGLEGEEGVPKGLKASHGEDAMGTGLLVAGDSLAPSAEGAVGSHLKCVNMRDLASSCPQVLKPGMLFRSSEILRGIQYMKIKTILDLRRKDRPCKTDASQRLPEVPPASNKPTTSSPPAHPQPLPCLRCSEKCSAKYGAGGPLRVFHADLIQGRIGLHIFLAMPWKVRLQALRAAVTGAGAESVMTSAVADPLIYGYKKLYQTLLSMSHQGVATAMRVLADPTNFPVLIHCVHGKDRTGVLVMLLLALCGVDDELIVADYVQSGKLLKDSKLAGELQLKDYLTADAVIAAEEETIQDTLRFVKERWGSAEGYLLSCGLSPDELAAIRANLKTSDGC